METLTVGALVRRLRRTSGMTQAKLAERLDIDATYLSHIEANRREPSVGLLRRIAEELSLPTGLLLAMTLWVDLPPQQRDQYRKIIESLTELALVSQLGLFATSEHKEPNDS